MLMGQSGCVYSFACLKYALKRKIGVLEDFLGETCYRWQFDRIIEGEGASVFAAAIGIIDN